MPINTNSKTRKQIRQSIGEMTGAMITGTVNGTGTSAQVIDSNGLTGGDDEYNGRFIAISDAGTADAEYRRVTDYTSSSTTLALQTALSFTPTTSDTYELWDERMPPERVNTLINDAIEELSQTFLVPDQDESLFGTNKQRTYTVPSNIKLLSNVKVRNKVTHKLLNHANSDDWVAGTSGPALTTVSKDTNEYREGGASLNLLNSSSSIADGTVLAYKNLAGAVDISHTDKVEFWVKSSTALSAGSLELELRETDNTGTTRETLSLPALSANTWTRCNISLTNPWLDTAIKSLQFVSNHASELDSAEIWVNRIQAIASNTEEFEDMGRPGWLWRVNREDQTLNFSPEGRARISNQKIKLIGFDTPAKLTTDSATCEIDATTVEFLAAARLLQAMSGGRLTDVDESRTLANQYRLLAADRMSREPTYYGVETK